MHYAETIAVHGASLVQQQVFIAPEKRSEIVIKLESKRLAKSLEVIDAHLTDRDYLLRTGFSAVDTGVAYSVHLAQGRIDITGLKNVVSYYERCKARPAFEKSVAGS